MEEDDSNYIIFRNGADEAEYEHLKEELSGINYEEVEDESYFRSKPLSSPVLGVESSVGYISHDGWAKIKSALEQLEDRSIKEPDLSEA